ALLGAFGWGTFAAGLLPVLAIGLNWKRANALAANVAIVSSLLVNFGLRGLGIRLPYGVDHGAAALVVSLVLFLSISFLTRPEPIPRDIRRVMDL
ncbi:MAG: sodium/proline symporter, partial [Acidimicrobiia bacterium]|nr:sodium/proline symporter [Acidimicrobiia bacterium]